MQTNGNKRNQVLKIGHGGTLDSAATGVLGNEKHNYSHQNMISGNIFMAAWSQVEEQFGIHMARFGGMTDYCGRMVWVKFPVHILLHACNTFLNRRLYSLFLLSLLSSKY